MTTNDLWPVPVTRLDSPPQLRRYARAAEAGNTEYQRTGSRTRAERACDAAFVASPQETRLTKPKIRTS